MKTTLLELVPELLHMRETVRRQKQFNRAVRARRAQMFRTRARNPVTAPQYGIA